MLKQLTARLDQWADLRFPVHAQMMAIQVGPGFASVGDALPTKPQQHLTSVLALFRSRVRIPKVGSAEVGLSKGLFLRPLAVAIKIAPNHRKKSTRVSTPLMADRGAWTQGVSLVPCISANVSPCNGSL